MKLILKRSQRQGGMLGGKIVFVLDARSDLTSQETSLVSKYGLGKLSIYDSEAHRRHVGALNQNLDEGKNASPGISILKSAAAVGRAAMAALSLRVTVESLRSGQHIECKDLDELLGAEAAIMESCQTLKAYLETAETFDGREEVIEF